MATSTALCASAALLVTAGFASIQPSRAQVIPQTIPGILCDTEADVRSIVSANQQSTAAVQDVFRRLNAQLNSKNQPVCSIQEVPHTMVSVPQSIDVGPWPQNGEVREAFILHIHDDTIDAWFLYVASGGGSGNGGSKA